MKSLMKTISINEIFKYLVVLSLILASGGNPLIRSIYFFVICCLIYMLYKRKQKVKFVFVAAVLIIYVWLDSCLLNTAATSYKECVLLSVRIGCSCITATNISIQEFKKIFVNIMTVLAPMSLFFFIIYVVAGRLPGTVYLDGWVGAFYQTVGYGNALAGVLRKRNCGIFTEPGVYQMYLNFALLALASQKNIPLKKARTIFYIFSITMISTFSSMGYLLYACVMVVIYIERRELLPFSLKMNKKSRIALILFLMIVFAIAEYHVSGISSFVTGANSWASRHDDTLLTFLIAKDFPLFGVGLATDILPIWDRYYVAYENLRLYKAYQNAMSCGLGNYMAMGGVPFAIVYLVSIIKAFFKMFDFKTIFVKIIVAFVLVMFVIEEPLLPTPLYLICFFYSLKSRDEKAIAIVREKKEYESIVCPKPQIEN